MMAVNLRIPLDGKQPDQISEDCIICCEKVTDKAFVNKCLHYFCFKCIKEWVKVRAVCPLCVQPIDSIINNVRAADDYDLQPVEPPATDVLSNYLDADVDLWATVEDDDDFNEDVELSSDETHDVVSSSDSDEVEHDYHYAMSEDSNEDSDVSFGDATNSPPPVELFSNSEDDEGEEIVKSYQSSDSDMEDDGWQEYDTENGNSDNDDCGSDIANDSDELELSDYTCDSEYNDYQPNPSPEPYVSLSESEDGYEYLTDADDYNFDETYEEVSDLDYY